MRSSFTGVSSGGTMPYSALLHATNVRGRMPAAFIASKMWTVPSALTVIVSSGFLHERAGSDCAARW